jgi:large conductance mechanosensitive channel
MKKFLQEFKEFALRGNVMDLAVGVIIGAAFSDIVTSLTNNFINPILNLLTHPKNIAALNKDIVLDSIATYGSNFLSSVINFIIMAFILFCLMKAINTALSLGKRVAPEEEETPTTKECPFCKSEISIAATRCPHCASELEFELEEEA